MRHAIALLLVLCAPASALAHDDVAHTLAESQRRLEAAPQDASRWIARAQMRRLAGDPAGASSDLDRAEKLTPGSSHVRVVRGALALDGGRHAEACAHLDAALAKSPDLHEARRLRARAHALLGRPLESASDWRAVIAGDPHSGPDDYAALIGSLVARGARNEARQVVADGLRRLGPVPYLLEQWHVLAPGEASPPPSLGANPAAIDHIATVPAAAVTRGPYLQMASPNAITIRWRTDVATDSRVRFGTSWAQLDQSASDNTLTTEHEVRLSGLTPQTRYFYSVGTQTETIAGGDSTFRFDTPLPVGSTSPIRTWIIGDSGRTGTGQRLVRDAYADYPGASRTDLWLMLGDNAYDTGTNAEYQAAVFDAYPEMLRRSVLWPTRGNHDLVFTGTGNDYYDFFTLPDAAQAGGIVSGTEAYYSFDVGNVHFICLDSQGTSRSPGGPMNLWLRDDLQATQQDWVIAYWHHPPYTKGSHDSDVESQLLDMRQNFLPVLEQYGVDLVLTGHSHSYERSFLLDQHYGLSASLHDSMKVDSGDGDPLGDGAYEKPTYGAPSPHEGAVYAVVGSSSQIGGGMLNHPAMVTSLPGLGSLVLDIEGNRLDAAFLSSTEEVADRFSIVKGTVVAAPHSAPGARTIVLAVLPNPSRGPAHLRLTLPTAAEVAVSIHDAAGRKVSTLAAGAFPAGVHLLSWDGSSESGRRSPPGVYFARLRAGVAQLTTRIVREP